MDAPPPPPSDGWVCLEEGETSGTFSRFLDAVNVWINRPNVVYKKLFGAQCNNLALSPPASPPSATNGDDSFIVLVRELLPRASGHESSYEKVTVGMQYHPHHPAH